jgi:hydrogenase large subunit
MATKTPTVGPDGLVDMAWDPITRIVGSLGIYTKIDFNQKRVAECWSTSSIFRGYSIFMKGKDPRDAHFITSRICGICGDNHATCSCYAQNMAYGVHPPALGEQIVNLGEAAEYMFDHNIFQENLVGVDFCEKMVAETNPGVLDLANRTEAPGAAAHGYKTVGDIMRALNPFSGEFYREALQVSRYTREMFCLMEGRHVHPSTLYPGGVGTTATIQLFTDYYTRLMRYVEFMKRVVPLHDDLFNFFYEALPGYEEVGRRRVLLGCWGAFQDPDVCNFEYKDMTQWGRAMGVTPGVVVDGKLVTNDLVEINLGIRILLGHSYYDSWEGQEMFVTRDPLGNPVDRNHPWNQHTIPQPQKRDFDGNYSWVMSPRWFDGTDHLALDTGGGPIARLWSTALSGLVDTDHLKATGQSVVINLPRTALLPEVTSSGRCRSGPTRSSGTGLARTSRPTPPRPRSTSSSWRSPTSVPARPRRGSRSRFPTKGSVAGSPKRSAACSRITSSSEVARSPTTTPTRRHRGTRTRATSTARRDPTRTPCSTPRSSRRTASRTSRASTSCEPCAASIRASPVESTCTSARARS